MSKYYMVDPWFASVSVQGQKVNAVFDTGNASHSVISCKRFPSLKRIQIPVPERTIQYFNTDISPQYGIPPLVAINMKDLYKYLQGRIPQNKYIDVMESLGFIFTQSGNGSFSIVNLEIVSLEFQIEGVPFPLSANLYCSYVSDIEFDILFSMKYISNLLDRKIIITPTRRTKELYTEISNLEKDIRILSIRTKQLSSDIDTLVSDPSHLIDIQEIISKKQRRQEIHLMKFPAREVLLSEPE